MNQSKYLSLSTLLICLSTMVQSFQLSGCTKCESDPAAQASDPVAAQQQQQAAQSGLTILTGSENEALEPLVMEWAQKNNVPVSMKYQGSVDIMRCISGGKACAYDAVWPAQSLWISIGDTQSVLKSAKSIMHSPIVLGVRKSVAVRLGWTGSKPVTFKDILAAAEKNEFKMSMTSATQSNSGASAYLGIWYAMSGNPDMLQAKQLNDGPTGEKVRQFLSNVDRGSGSSGWLKEALVQDPDKFGSMINYEAMVIEANAGWTKKGQHVPGLAEGGKEPLCAVYPADGMTVADSPLAYLDRGDAKKAQQFAALQDYLLSKPAQDRIKALGRRTGLLGMDADGVDAKVWNPDWCINVKSEISPVPTPSPDVIRQALSMYQTNLRKPSLTVWVLDTSSSMNGNGGIDGLKSAMRMLFDPATAEQNMLQLGPRDVTIVITFAHEVGSVWKLEGNSPDGIRTMLERTTGLIANGGTNMYLGLNRAMDEIKAYHDSGKLWDYLPAINVMTDGQSMANNAPDYERHRKELSFMTDVPINTIPFGSDADTTQLDVLTKASTGKSFPRSNDLPKTLRDAKGYN